MGKFYSKVAGVTHKGPDGTDRQSVIAKHIKVGSKLEAIPEPDNKYDKNAIGLWFTKKGFFSSSRFHIGYIDADKADRLSGEMQRGKEVLITVKDITGGGKKALGLNLIIDS